MLGATEHNAVHQAHENQFQMADYWYDWLIEGLIPIACVHALANGMPSSCSVWATVDGIHQSVFGIWCYLRRIQDRSVMSGLMHHPTDVCSRGFLYGQQQMLASLQFRSLKKRHYLPSEWNEPVPTEQDLLYNHIWFVCQLLVYFDCLVGI